jgi:hypothetical protein
VLTIASPNTDRTLLDITELRAAAGVSNGSKDTELTLLGGYVAASITKACKVATDGAIPPTLRLETVSETFRLHYQHNSSRRSSLILARLPIIAIASVTENDTLLDTDQFEYDAAAGLLYRLSGSCRVPWCGGTVVVVYSAGYAVVPDDLKYAAIKFVKAALQQDSRDPMLMSKRTEGVSEYRWFVDPTKESVVPAEVMDLLERGGYVNTVMV